MGDSHDSHEGPLPWTWAMSPSARSTNAPPRAAPAIPEAPREYSETWTATAADGRTNAHEVMIGVVAGTAASSVAHTALGTVDPLWREGVLVWTGVVVVCAAFLAASLWTLRAEAGEPAPVGPRAWLSLGPLLFLTGLYTANPAVARTLAETPYASVVTAVVAISDR